MLITQTASPPCLPLRAAGQEPTPEPEPPRDGWQTASEIGCGTLLGAGVGFLGLHAGARAGLVIGMLATSEGAGLGALLSNSLLGIQIGGITGAVVGATAGIALGVLLGQELRNAFR
ncbi:MAG: hypothetical protein AB1758_09530 [Candidatus Eremiobacterota bacterium]